MLPPLADRFVAGETAAAALEHARSVNRDGCGVILNLLGEHYADPEDPRRDVRAYRRLIREIDAADLRGCISVKPTQLGLDIDDSTFTDHVSALAEYAADREVFLWLDMEGSDTTDATLDAYETLATRHDGGVGVCVQANLRRTRSDLERLAPLPGKVRLVKGAYDERAAIAYRERSRVNRSFRDCLAYMFEAFEDGIAVGSHDQAMIEHAIDLHDAHGTPFEIQMLMGVREEAQRELAADFEVWQYAPYGSRWLPYFTRRVAERRENLGFALRAIAGSLR